MKTKKEILFLILVSISKIGIAQQYYPFPSRDAVWREYTQRVGGASNSLISDFQNFLSGDTIFLGKTYHKIYRTRHDYGNNLNENFSKYYMNEYVGAIREDSSKRVYLLGKPEILLYDFNLNIGDTLPQIYVDSLPAMYGTYNSNGFIYSVSEIDSVLVSGVFHKRFKIVYAEGRGTVYLIEGIGASTGLISWFFGSLPWGYRSNLICFKQDNIDSYPSGIPCDLVEVGVNEISSKKQIHVIPNPSTGRINFVDIPDEPLMLKIFNILGECIYETNDTNFKQSMDLSFLPKGIIFLLVITKDKPPIFEKIILQ